MARNGKGKVPFLQRHHFYWVFIAAMGYLFFPPMAILCRFGITRDFFINVLLTCCGYFPGVVHNFYCQNIRDNSNRGRTPKWAIKAGFVRDPEVKRSRQRQWAHRYNERAPINPYDDPNYQEQDVDGNVPPPSNAANGLGRSGRTSSHFSAAQTNPQAPEDQEQFYDSNTGTYGATPGETDAHLRNTKKVTGQSKRSGSRGTADTPGLDAPSSYNNIYSPQSHVKHAHAKPVDTDTLRHEF